MAFSAFKRYRHPLSLVSKLRHQWDFDRVTFIPKYFSLFNTIVNGIVFSIMFLVCSLLVYRNATDFCLLILPWNFTESFIRL